MLGSAMLALKTCFSIVAVALARCWVSFVIAAHAIEKVLYLAIYIHTKNYTLVL